MKDADRTIERLLTSLRDAEPSTGIERRILEAMEAREAVVSASLARRWRWRLHPAAAMGYASGVVLMTALAIIIVTHRFRGAPADTSSHAAVATVPQGARPEAIAHTAPIVPRRSASRALLRHSADLPVVAETEADSFPAPPLPLTSQEKLLLRLAHRHDPEDTAILNPAVQAAESAKAAAQFQQFFEINAAEMRSQIE